MKHFARSYRLLIAVAVIICIALALLPVASTSRASADPQQIVQAAWQRAQDSGVYRFTTELVQTTYPAPKVANTGRSSRTETIYLDGETNLPARQFQLSVRNNGSMLNTADALQVRVDGDKAYGRSPGGEWREMDSFTDAFAPGSDLMVYLAGAKNVQVQANSAGGLSQPYTQYSFELDGPALANRVRDQLEQYLIEKGELPQGLSLEAPTLYREATGQGSISISDDGLPLRLSLKILYPREASGAQVEAELKTDFTNYAPVAAAARFAPIDQLARSLGLPRTASDWKHVGSAGAALFMALGLVYALTTRSRSKKLQAALVLAIIFSMVFTPLIDGQKAYAFTENQKAQQAAADQQQKDQEAARAAEAQVTQVTWDPHTDPLNERAAAVTQPLEPAKLIGLEKTAPLFSAVTGDTTFSTVLCTETEKLIDTDNDLLTDCAEKEWGTRADQKDTDQDGLTDGIEALRLGTDPLMVDSDGDAITDYLEVTGFVLAGGHAPWYSTGDQRWYSDPNEADTDKDNLPDGLECPERALNIAAENDDQLLCRDTTGDGVPDSCPQVQAVCRDTNADATPDMFARDSDGDGVPDKLDLAPTTVVGKATPFSAQNPFNLIVNNLNPKAGTTSTYYPVFVDFQLRPVNPQHLTYALNVLDWPSGDEGGQVQRRTGNNSTFASGLTPAQVEGDPSTQNGDVRLIPLLELELSGNNLPLPMTTTVKTQVQLQGVDTSWPVSTTPPVFTTWLSGTLNFAQAGNNVNVNVQFDGAPQLKWLNIYTGTCAAGGNVMTKLTAGSASNVVTDTKLVNLADGNHFVMASGAGHVSACADLPDLPNGTSLDQIVDEVALAPYGVSVRDKDRTGTMLLYLPLNITPDDGGGRVAFSARMMYQPRAGNLGDVAQRVRLVWAVQALTDWCKAPPEDADLAASEVWCNYEASWNLDNVQFVHTYVDEWLLTGMSVREDHGVNVAVAWEDPSLETADSRKFDDALWMMAEGLDTAFIGGRDQDGKTDQQIRDIGVITTTDGVTVADTTIAGRFDTPLASSVTITDRFGVPLTAALQVNNYAYPHQDGVAALMMNGTRQILSSNFNAYTDTTPTLLFAREERYRSVGLETPASRSVSGNTVTFDFTGELIETTAALNWAPYRFKDGVWQAYPLNEYWDMFGTRLKQVLPDDPALPADQNDSIKRGKVIFAQAYYYAMNQGRAALVQIGNDLAYRYSPHQSDRELTMTLMSSAFGVGGGVGAVIKKVVEQFSKQLTELSATLKDKLTAIAMLTKYGFLWSDLPNTLFSVTAEAQTSKSEALKKLVSSALDKVGSKVKAKLPASIKGRAGAGIGLTAVVVLSFVAVMAGFAYADTALMLSALTSVGLAAVQVGLAIYTIYQAATKTLETITRTVVVCAVIGLIIGTVIAFGCAIATLVTGHLKFGSAAANAVFAQAIAYTIVAVILFVISMIPVVGQIIVAILGAIDALISAACAVASAAVGYDVRENAVGQWVCKGISGLAAELVKWGIYSSAIMIELQDPNRLQFGKFNYHLVNPDKGLTVGSGLTYQIDLTDTITLETVIPLSNEAKEQLKSGTSLIPADWKSMSYAWQFNTNNLKSSTFHYLWQTSAQDIHDDLERDTMNGQWTLTGHENRVGVDDQAYITRTVNSNAITLNEAGINRNPTLFLTEGMAIPQQECFSIPIQACGIPYVCLVPVCYVRTDRSTNNFDFGLRLTLDVLPATLDGFYTAAAKDGGYSLAWGQAVDNKTFARQPDFDGDTLLNPADGGTDPNDSLWDIDGDSLSDGYEVQHGTNPSVLDSDADGLSDAEELRLGTSPNRPDTDGDGLTDQQEIIGWQYVYALTPGGTQLRTWVVSNPLDADEDFDTISDFKEKAFGFNPHVVSDPQVLDLQTGAREPNAPQLLLRLDEPAGVTTFADASGYGHTALCDLATCPTSGQSGHFGLAPQFSGDVLSMPHSNLNERVSNSTFSAWIYPTTVSGQQTILATARTVSNNGFSFGLSNNYLSLNLYGSQFFSSNTTLPANVWTHVAAVVATSGSDVQITFYKNGSQAGVIGARLTPSIDQDDVLLVGAETPIGSAAVTNTFNGSLDEVAIYHRALSSSEITLLSQGQYDPNDGYLKPGGTVAYTSTIGNKLLARYAQGLWSIDPVPGLPALSAQTLILPPQAQTAFSGTLQVNSVPGGVISLTQVAQAEITDWREQAGYAQLWLKLDDTSTTFADASGQNLNGSCVTATCPTRQATGYFDYGVNFAGSQFITLSDTQRLGLYDSSFSVSAWVKPSDVSSNRALLAIDRAAGANALRLEVQSGKPAFVMHNTTVTTTQTLRQDNWYHLVYRYDKVTQQASIYVNGELKGSQAGISPTLGLTTTAVLLGRAYNNTNYFRGAVDDVRVYARALELVDIRNLYNEPVLRLGFESAAQSSGSLKLYTDSSRFENRVSCSGNNCPTNVPGAAGQGATSFDGNDYLTVDRQPSLNLGDGQFTMAAWVKPTAQGEPVNAACNMTTYFNPPSGYPITQGCANFPVPSMDADSSATGTWLVNYSVPAGSYVSGFGGQWTGQFDFSAGTYTFYGNFRPGDTVTFAVDGVTIGTSVTGGSWWLPNGKPFTIATSGRHTLQVELRTTNMTTAPYVRFGWIPPHVQSIIGQGATSDRAYPTLQSIGRKVRFGFGAFNATTNQYEWYATTPTTETVLAANTWNHVALTFGPRYDTGGTFAENVATLYVNNLVKAQWGVGNRRPVTTTTSFDIGRATSTAKTYLDYFHLIEEADGVGDSAEIYLTWEGDKVCVAGQGDNCIWGGVKSGDDRDIHKSVTADSSSELRAWEQDSGVSDDDPLCDVGSGSCTAGYFFKNTQASIPFTYTFDWKGDDSGAASEDTTHLNLYLGDSSHWTYRNPSIPLKGQLDDVTIYKRPLSADDVQELYLSASSALYLTLDDAPGSQSFENSVDVSQLSNANCAGSACPLAGVSGRMNQAAQFDGSNDTLRTSLTLDQSPTSPGLTLMGWVKPSSTSTGRHDVFSTDTGSNQWSIVREADRWKIANGQSLVDTGLAVDVGKWQHLAAVFTPSTGIKFYKNGALAATLTSIFTATTSASLSIGGSVSLNNVFDGAIDDVRVFAKTLTDANIVTFWQSAPVWQLHLDESIATTSFVDAAGNNSATCSGVTCPTAGVAGQVGLGAEFNLSADGVGDKLSVADNNALDVGNFSIGAWVLPSAILTRSQTLIDKGTNFRLDIAANGFTPTLTMANPGGCVANVPVSSLASLMPNQWNHVMGTYDGSTLKIFVNGYQQGSVAVSGSACTNSSELALGNASNARFFAGRLDEVTLYNRALWPTEVRDTFLYQAKLVEERRTQRLIVDGDNPASQLQAFTFPYQNNNGAQLFITANDATSQVSLVELYVDKRGGTAVWQPAPKCLDATGNTAWCPYFAPSGEGEYRLQTRAVDAVGNRQNAVPGGSLFVDTTPPTLSSNLSGGALVNAQPHPTRQNAWTVRLGGTVSDPTISGASVPGSGVMTDSVRITLIDATTGAVLGDDRQSAAFSGTTWTIDYVVPEARPTGSYVVRGEAADRVGNVRAATNLVTIQIDATAPTADLNSTTVSATVITNTQTIGGNISEAPTPRNSGLLLHFEEAANARTFLDSSGWARHGVCATALCVTSSTGQYGQAVTFTGTQAISIAHSALTEVSNSFSIAAWVRPSAVAGTQRFIASARTRSNNGFSFGLNGANPQVSAWGGRDFNFNAPLTTGSWTHLAAVIDSNNSISLYVDGNLRGTITSTVPITPDLDDVLMIGGTTVVSGTTLTDAYAGSLDEVIVVARALTVDEVRTLAQRQTAGVSNVQVAFRSTLPGSPAYNELAPAGEVLHLTLEDQPTISGTLSFVDVSGLKHNGACPTGSTCPQTQQAGHTNNAVKFNGQQDKIRVYNFGNYTSTTLAGWVYQPAYSASSGYLIKACNVGLYVNSRLPFFEARVNNFWQKTSILNTPIPLNTWVFLAATYDGQALRLYQDGRLINTANATGSLTACTDPISIGDSFAGSLDEVRMFNRALSQAELKALYLGTSPIAQLSFDEAWLKNGDTTTDETAWKHNGTFHTDNVTNTMALGQVGAHALAFDGNQDYVSVAPHSGLDLSGGRFSVAAWVYPSPTDGNPYPIISSIAYTGEVAAYPFLNVVNRTQLNGGFGTGTAMSSFTTTSALTENAWNHVAATFDGTTYTLFVNGAARLTNTIPSATVAAAQQFDVGRGALASSTTCARLTNLSLTALYGSTQLRVKLDGTPVYTITAPVPHVAYTVLSNLDRCGTLQVAVEDYWGWSQLGSLTLPAAPGAGSITLSSGSKAVRLDWSMAVRPGDVRYWRGQLDDVRVYARALNPIEVQALALSGWQTSTLANAGSNLSAWTTNIPNGLEGSYIVDLRGKDTAGHVDDSNISRQVWSGDIDTLAPRVTLTRTMVNNQNYYSVVAEDFNLVKTGFSSPCGLGVISSTESYQAPWYQALAGTLGLSRTYRLKADCASTSAGLFAPGVWTTSTLVTGRSAVSGTQVYLANGSLLQINANTPSLPQLANRYDANGDARGVVISGTYAYVADGSLGLSAVNLLNPAAAPARRDTPGTALDVARYGNYVYVADGTGGLRIMDVSNPANPVEVTSYATTGNAQAVALSGNPGVLKPVAETNVDQVTTVEVVQPEVPPANLTSEEWASIQNQIEQANYTFDPGVLRPVATLTPTPHTANAYFGTAAAVDGDTLVVGASNINRAYVFTRHSGGDNQWGLSATIVPTDVVAGDNFGSAVALSGDWLVIGAPNAAYSGVTGNGRVYGYNRNQGGANAWGLIQNIDSIGNTNDHFGTAFALDGQVLAIGTAGNRVEMYDRQSNSTTWSLSQILTADNTTESFGAALALVNDTLFVGAPLADVAGKVDAGATYAYLRDYAYTLNNWTQVLTLTASDGAANDRFGSALSAAGEQLLIGAPQATVSGHTLQGAAYLYARNQGGASAWGQVKKLITVDGAANDTFGNSVALSGDRMLIGAAGFNSSQGKAYVFGRNEGGADNWGQWQTITLTGGLDAYPSFGQVVALKGDVLLIAAPNQDSSGNVNEGAAYIYAINAYAWGFQNPLTPSVLPSEKFGWRAALSGDTLAVTAPSQTGYTTTAVYLFQRNQGAADAWGLVKKLTGPDSELPSEYGYSIDLDGDTLVVGAPGADSMSWSPITNTGTALVYDRNEGGPNNWGEIGRLPLVQSQYYESAKAGERWGTSVAVAGDLIAIGGPNVTVLNDQTPVTNAGQVRLYRRPYHRTGDLVWWSSSMLGSLSNPVTQTNHYFGTSVALSADTLVVGAADNLAGPGAVYAYRLGLGWTKTITMANAGTLAGFGSEIRLDGNTLAAVSRNPIVTTTSQVQLYERNQGGADNWGLVQTLPATTSLGIQLDRDTLALSLGNQTQIRSRNQGGLNHWGLIQTLPVTQATGIALFGDTLAFGYSDSRQRGEIYRLAARPIGATDRYTINQHSTYVVTAPGVLVNDLKASGSTLTATLTTSPTHGALTLNANGAFTYTLGSTNHFTGTDTFTYRAMDGALASAPITVTIVVTPVDDAPTLNAIPDMMLDPSAPQQVVSLTGLGPGDPYENQRITVTAQSTNTALIPSPIVTYANPNVTGTLTFTPVAAQTGSATVVVTVTDGVTNTVRKFAVNVYPLSGPFAYIALGSSGLGIVNLSTPTQPRNASVVDTPGLANDVVVSGTYAYVADGLNGLVIIDIASATPHIVGRRLTPGNALGVSVIGRYAFIADSTAGVTQIDVSTPTSPTLIGTSDTLGDAANIAAGGRYLYVSDGAGGLRVFDSLTTADQVAQATACDSAGHCTTATATAVVVNRADETDAAVVTTEVTNNTVVSFLDAPSVLITTTAITLNGKAFSDLSSLRTLTVSVDGNVIATQNWAMDEISETLWSALWNPTNLPDSIHELRAEVSTWAGDTAGTVTSVVLDTQPPAVSLTTHVVTGTAYHDPGLLDLSGLITDTAGIQAVQVTFGEDTYGASLAGNVWRASLNMNQVPEGETYTVTVQAIDLGGHVAQTTNAFVADAAAPTNVDLTMREGGNIILPNTTIRTLSPTLTLDWSAASDGSGLQQYLVEWAAAITDTEHVLRSTQYPTRTSAYQPGEGQAVWARVGSEDVYGQQSWQSTGPFYIDMPRTPDYALLGYDDWQASGCSLIGVDRRIDRGMPDKAALNAAQQFFTTWSKSDLRLAWTGVNWDEDGDLFIYLDTLPGGTTTAFNPYIDTTPDTMIYLPGVTPTSTVSALAADYLVWVRDDATALLMHWQGAEWEYVETLSSDQYRYAAETNNGQTDLRVPFVSIGITQPNSAALNMVAFATEEDALRLWAVMPNANPVNSDQVVATSDYAGDAPTFALSRGYHWSNVGAGVCPNGSDGTSQSYADVDAHVSLTANPIGASYSLLSDNLFWLWDLLAGERSADVTSAFDFMSADHPRVGANQTITYMIEYRNNGTATAHNVEADLSPLYALQLNGPSTRVLGAVGPGQIVTATFSGQINLSASSLAWAAVAANVYDDGHPRSGEPLDRLWVDHQVDRSAPEFIGLLTPADVIRPQRTTLSGFAYDESAIPLLTLNVSGQSPINYINAVSKSGQWSCALDATGQADGTVLNLSLQATDGFGQASTTTTPQAIVVDAIPPTTTIDLAQNQIVNSANLNLSGSATDNHGLDHVEVCADGTCTNAALQLAGGTALQIVDDAPENGIAIDGRATCGGGEIVRTFDVTQDFPIGEVRVGFNATHADRDEVRVQLSGPSSTSVRLLDDDNLSGTHMQNYAVMLSDAASQTYATRSDDAVTMGFDRSARPYQPLRVFNGQSSAGTWTLRICDTSPAANDGLYQRSQLVLVPQATQRLAPTGTWNYALANTDAQDYVAHTVSVYGVDRAGNRATEATQRTYIVDNFAPVLTVTQLVNTAVLTYSLPVLQVTATDGGGIAQVVVFVETPNTTYSALATPNGTDWRFDLPADVVGIYRMSISVYDNAGNVASAGPYQVNITAPPTYSVFLPLIAR